MLGGLGVTGCFVGEFDLPDRCQLELPPGVTLISMPCAFAAGQFPGMKTSNCR